MIKVKRLQIGIRESKYLWAFNASIKLDKSSSFTIEMSKYYYSTYIIMEIRQIKIKL